MSTVASPRPLAVISSMATRLLLAELSAQAAAATGVAATVESVGGVDAARRVAAGEPFDAVVLASDAIERLMAAGHLQPGSRVDLVRSAVAVAVRDGAPRPEIGNEQALRAAVLAARSIGYSTGPSGTALAQLFARWGLADVLAARLVVPPPGVPVGSLVASGEVELGFQQLSELLPLQGISVVGGLPPEVAIVTVFSGAVAARAAQPDAARGWLQWLAGDHTTDTKRRQGMDAP